MRYFLQLSGAACALVLLSACAVPEQQSQSQQQAMADGDQADVVCFFEAATGTNRKVRRCMSKEDYNNAQDAARRMGNDIKIPPPEPKG